MACEPIKDKEIVKEILSTLKTRRCGERDSLFFEFLFSTALRVSDALDVKKSDIDFIEGTVRVKIKKTKGYKKIQLNTPILKDLHTYTTNMAPDAPIFPFQRQHAHRIMKWVTDYIGLDSERYSMHSTRKTAAWFFYIDSGYDIIKTMHFLGHKNPKETQIYLMIHEDEVNQQLQGMSWR